MLSDEEKQAIEYLKARLYGNEGCKFIDVAQSDLRIFLNLIEKQSKEIEELKKKTSLLKSYKANLPENVEFICLCKNDFERNISDDYISKDKIKAKIEELKAYKTVLSEPDRQILRFNIEKFEYGIELFQSLLEEEE